LIISPIDW